MGIVEKRIADQGLSLPETSLNAKFALAAVCGDVAHVAGVGSKMKGKLGKEITIKQGFEAAQQVGLQLLANLQKEVGSLDRVSRVLKATCFVNSDPVFTEQPAVANGFTELMLSVFGPEVGLHARTAVGVASLPNGSAIEIDMIITLRKKH
jgi:enamine deaminase RidA (YjgF/YER057c/UK114 family)